MTVKVHWHMIDPNHPIGNAVRCLYAYLDPESHEILYVGKAWGKSVRERRIEKQSFWRVLETERGIYKHVALIGVPELEQGGRLTKELLADIESLLIIHEQPCGNKQCRKSRIRRPGLVVHCLGAWPGAPTTYVDD
jgi:hypothetical protein